MNHEQAKETVDEIFNSIRTATSNEHIDELISGELYKNKMDSEAYPYLHFSLTPSEIQELINSRLINSDGNITPNISERDDLNPLTKLLYSVLWKNGDLKKIKHIVQGIQQIDEPTSDKEDGLVFYQFGKFLTKTGQPIIDQHVLRAFAIYRTTDLHEVEQLRWKGTLNKKDRPLIEDYKNWLKSNELTAELRSEHEYSYHIDQLLFALGKTIKTSKRTRGNSR
ncbi:MAG: hypothetical protein RLN88_03535 [Ekhidna sp.]|uniref:hypothetical protein n=1 Tax=Ekhidna sp. TaxID=2608089 RepID=UPI0032F087BF